MIINNLVVKRFENILISSLILFINCPFSSLLNFSTGIFNIEENTFFFKSISILVPIFNCNLFAIYVKKLCPNKININNIIKSFILSIFSFPYSSIIHPKIFGSTADINDDKKATIINNIKYFFCFFINGTAKRNISFIFFIYIPYPP